MRNNPFDDLQDKLDSIESKIDRLASKPDPSPDVPERLLTTDQFCDAVGISRVTLWNWDKKGITHPLRIGNLKRYRLSDLDALEDDSES